MDPQHIMYNQPGPSNFVGAYPPQETRPQPQYQGRGRGYSNHRNTQPNGQYHQQPQQTYYPPPVHMPYPGYGMNINGMNGMPINGQYNQGQAGIPRRGGPNYQSGNFQAPGSPALHPTHIYNPHAPPFIAPVAQSSSSSPMYHYSPSPAHIQHYSTPYSPPVHPHFSPYPHAQNVKSPMISPLQEHQNTSSPRPWKLQAASPRPPPAAPVTVPTIAPTIIPTAVSAPLREPYVESQISPHQPSLSPVSPPQEDPVEAPPQATEEKPQVAESESDPSPSAVAPAVANSPSTSMNNSPEKPKFELPSFIDEPAPKQEWVIASLPEDPTAAFGLMISPKAKPPPHIVQGAQKYESIAVKTTKPLSESPIVKTIKLVELSSEAEPVVEGHSTVQPPVAEEKVETPILHSEQLSATETESHASVTTDVFVPGSPLSTTTSVSATAPVKSEGPPEKEKEGQTLTAGTESISGSISASPKPSSQNGLPSTVTSIPSPTISTATPPVKKSWASLLRSDGSSSKSSLPTSSIQGFSIPSEATDRPPASSTTDGPAKQRDLLRLLTNGPGIGNSVLQIRPRGLVNTGNMCFANAVLQTLVYTPLFSRLFAELGKYISGVGPSSTKWDGKETPMVDATVDFLKEFKQREKSGNKDGSRELYGGDDDDFDGIDSFIPSNIYDAMKSNFRFEHMGGGQQEDAEEFFGFFLDTLEEELLTIMQTLSPSNQKVSEKPPVNEDDGWLEVGKKNKAVVTRSSKSVDSPITRIFGGKFRSTLKVPGQRDSVMVEDWRSLQLDIQREQVTTIEDALRYISHPQPVQVSSVTKGNAVVEATQQVMMDVFPPVLVLHLKRFLYDTTAKDVKKVHKQVNYGPELEIPSDAVAPNRRTSQPVKYKLFSVIYHHGQSAAGGHYTLDVLHPNRNSDSGVRAREGWIRIDDELVSDLRSEDVFGKDRDCAYLLFYRKVGGSYAARAGQ